MSMAEKVTQEQSSSQSEGYQPRPELLQQDVRKDMGKVSLFVAAMSVLLIVVFYFVLNNNIAGLQAAVNDMNAVDDEVQALSSSVQTLEETMSDMDSRVADLDESVLTLEEKVADLETLPQETRNMIYVSLLEDISQKAGYLSGELEGADQEQIQEAMQMIEQIREGLSD